MDKEQVSFWYDFVQYTNQQQIGRTLPLASTKLVGDMREREYHQKPGGNSQNPQTTYLWKTNLKTHQCF